jgi:ubiquinone/menaquinone biosynthesis C-methylase UbiE
MTDAAEIQRQYYAATAWKYDAKHLGAEDEHAFALSILMGTLDMFQIRSILDVGSGTGRAVLHIKALRPDIRVCGVEPVRELREQGYAKGLGPDELVDGNAMALPYRDGEFDLVAEFGVLHHVRAPDKMVAEMLRTAKTAIFISDSNNFGQGRFRALKQVINALGLWPLANAIKTRGKGYAITEGDGLAYSYSVFTNYQQIKEQCSRVHVINTRGSGFNHYRTADHVALLGIK